MTAETTSGPHRSEERRAPTEDEVLAIGLALLLEQHEGYGAGRIGYAAGAPPAERAACPGMARDTARPERRGSRPFR